MTPTDTPTAPEPVYFDLGQTATYKRRRLGWFPGPHPDHPDHRLGTLRLNLEKRGRSRDGDDVDDYGLQEERGTGAPAGVRSFLLRNDTDAEQPDVYRCVVGADERSGLVYDACTCRAGLHGKRCKHQDAIEKLIAEGVL